MRTAEAKAKHYNWSKFNLSHNTITTCKLNDSAKMPTEGSGDDQRNGDMIYTGGICLRALFGQVHDRPNMTFKYWVLLVPKGATYYYDNWFKNITGNVLCDPINKDYVKCIKQGVIKPTPAGNLTSDGGIQDVEYTFPFKLWIPYRRKLKFGPTDGDVNHGDKDLYLLLTAYDAYGTVTATTTLGYCQFSQSLYYKDP